MNLPARFSSRFHTSLGLSLGLYLALAVTAAPADARRIVAIGDIHGAADALVEILQQSGLLDDHERWSGGDAVLVQTGDFLDRGAEAIAVAELLMELQEQAAASGGDVVVLLGNHEILNLFGDLRDVTVQILHPFVDARSEARRTFLCKSHVKIEKRRAELLGQRPVPSSDLRQQCLQAHPLGLIEYREALGPDKPLGRWLRGLPAVAQVGKVVFLHGGLSASIPLDVDAINARVRGELEVFDQVRAWLVEEGWMLPTAGVREQLEIVRQMAESGAATPDGFAEMLRASDWLALRPDGPFWFRGYAKWEESEGSPQIDAILHRLGAEYLVVGHTPRASHSIESRFDDRVFLIDTGMLSSVYRGRPAALEIYRGRFTAIYPEQREVLRQPFEGERLSP